MTGRREITLIIEAARLAEQSRASFHDLTWLEGLGFKPPAWTFLDFQFQHQRLRYKEEDTDWYEGTASHGISLNIHANISMNLLNNTLIAEPIWMSVS